MWLAALVNARLGAKAAREIAVALGIVAFVGEHRADAGHDGEGGEEQALEDERVVALAAVTAQATGTPSPSTAAWYFVPAWPGPSGLGQ